MRRAAKVDRNHPEIVAALRAAGARVQSLAAVGDGVPDLLVGYHTRFLAIEIKDGTQIPSKRKLTPEQVEWHRMWDGYPVFVVETAEEALKAIGAIHAK